MQRYMLFGGIYYYPSGGIKDLIMCSDAVDELLQKVAATKNELDWWHIYDSAQQQVISSQD